MKRNELINKITNISILIGVSIILQLIANYITFGPVSITLALIPIVIGAIIIGPLGGFIIGLVVGLIILPAPSTTTFFSYNPLATIFLCLIKTSVAGLVSGLLFKLISKKNEKVATVIASLIVPIVNTFLFAIGCLVFFKEFLINDSQGVLATLVFGFIGFNFIIEFAINTFLSSAIYIIIKHFKNKRFD